MRLAVTSATSGRMGIAHLKPGLHLVALVVPYSMRIIKSVQHLRLLMFCPQNAPNDRMHGMCLTKRNRVPFEANFKILASAPPAWLRQALRSGAENETPSSLVAHHDGQRVSGRLGPIVLVVLGMQMRLADGCRNSMAPDGCCRMKSTQWR